MSLTVNTPVTSRSSPTVTLPVTFKLPRVPTCVIFVCNGSNSKPATPAPDMFPVTTTLPIVTLPVTSKLSSVPTAVIFVWLPVSKVPAMLVNTPVAPDTLPVVTLPVTSKLSSVPTAVIFV